LAQSPLNPTQDAFFSYNTGCLEILELLHQQEVLSVVAQIDPARVEEELVREERDRWPGWESSSPTIPESYYQRLAREWELCRVVMVNSLWSKAALIRQGVPEAKLIVVPLAFESPIPQTETAVIPGKQLKVLWLGTVNLRKGFPYFLEAARLLQAFPVKFTVAGPVSVTREVTNSAPRNVKFLGGVSRELVPQIYEQAQVYVLPTISDGFALTQLEAMHYGLPVITTPHCGAVVRDGVDGFIVPVRQPEKIAEKLMWLAEHPHSLHEMSRQAKARARDFSLRNFAHILFSELDRIAKASLSTEPRV
jgi:glycosyltransferase involved in cell wall biosynthesis